MSVNTIELLRVLNEQPSVEVIVPKELIDEVDASPETIERETGRKWRPAVEYTYDEKQSLAFYEEKIVFAAKEEA